MTLFTSWDRGYHPKDEKSKERPRINDRVPCFRALEVVWSNSHIVQMGRLKTKEGQ